MNVVLLVKYSTADGTTAFLGQQVRDDGYSILGVQPLTGTGE